MRQAQDTEPAAFTRGEIPQWSSLHGIVRDASPATASHCARVARLALELAIKTGLRGEELRAVAATAMVHDIGKLGIPASILDKPGALTESEFARVREHPQLGYEMLRWACSTAVCTESVRLHHERWDGRGYPYGVSGEAVPLIARIIAVADAYDAMVSDRPYRKAMGHEAALAEVRACSGTQFDPALASAFAEIDFEMINESDLALQRSAA
ncbi:MAG: HD-GYP domain-containing protein [Phycisphaerales bacterium]|nr:HD-GYP domain-containing protein [Phycisphaerales bacterium]